MMWRRKRTTKRHGGSRDREGDGGCVHKIPLGNLFICMLIFFKNYKKTISKFLKNSKVRNVF